MNEYPSIEDRLASMQRQLAENRQGLSPASKVRAGERLVVSYESDLMPEWLVLDTSDEMLLLTPVMDDLGDQNTQLVLRFPPNDIQGLVCPRLVVAAPRATLKHARRLECISRFYLEKVLDSLRTPDRYRPLAAWRQDADRFIQEFGARLIEAPHSDPWRVPVSAPLSPEPIPLYRSPKTLLLSAIALAACAIGLVFLPARNHRVRSGEYTIRGTPGEVGLELRIDGQPCLAMGQDAYSPCPVSGDSDVRLVYRLDAAIQLNHLLVVYEGPTGSEVIYSTQDDVLPRTTTADHLEKCSEGFCLIANVKSRGIGPGKIVAYFARDEAHLAPIFRAAGPATVVDDLIEYSFPIVEARPQGQGD